MNVRIKTGPEASSTWTKQTRNTKDVKWNALKLYTAVNEIHHMYYISFDAEQLNS